MKKYWKNAKKNWKSQGKVREIRQFKKVGTMKIVHIYRQVLLNERLQ